VGVKKEHSIAGEGEKLKSVSQLGANWGTKNCRKRCGEPPVDARSDPMRKKQLGDCQRENWKQRAITRIYRGGPERRWSHDLSHQRKAGKGAKTMSHDHVTKRTIAENEKWGSESV